VFGMLGLRALPSADADLAGFHQLVVGIAQARLLRNERIVFSR